jgi:hypothetical protein
MIHKWHMLVVVFAAATITSAAASAGPVVNVADVEQLYAAVNNNANTGATVVLAPGIYSLSPDHLNGGRLELQEDMSLYGVVGDRAAVIIDASYLPSTAFTAVGISGRTGIIRTGRGSNAIEWLTIAGNEFAAAAVETDLVKVDPNTGQPTPAAIRVAHVVAGCTLTDNPACHGSARGVRVRNIGSAMAGRRLEADIVDSDFYHGVEGIRVANFSGADGGEISVAMRGNRSYRNWLGCAIDNNRSSSASIYVRSSGDRFDDNGLGCQIDGGHVTNAGGCANDNMSCANDNMTTFEAHGSAFTNNTRTSFFNDTGPEFVDRGGLLISAAEVALAATPGSASRNRVVVRLWGSKIAENYPYHDIDAYGARSRLLDQSKPAGTDNQALIELYGVSKFIDVVAEDSVPPDSDPSGTNRVTVVRRPQPHRAQGKTRPNAGVGIKTFRSRNSGYRRLATLVED